MPQAEPLARARQALEHADTAAAVAALEQVAGVIVRPGEGRDATASARLAPGALSALMLLQWMARSATQEGAGDIWEEQTALLGGEHDQPDDVAIDVVLLARWLERGSSRRFSDAEAALPNSWRRLLRVRNAARFAADPEAAGWAKVTLAQWDLGWLDERLLYLPPRTEDSWRCPPSRYGWCVVRDPLWSPGQVGRLVEADTVLEPVLRRLKLDLHDAATGPWPVSEVALRMRIGLQLALYTRSPDPMIEDRVRTADLPEPVRAELLAVLAQFGSRWRRADSIMQAHPAVFAPLDHQRGMFSTGELSPTAFWLAAWPLYLEPFNARLLAHRGRLLLADILDRMIPGEGGFGLYPGRTALVLRGMPEMVYRLRDTSEISWRAGEQRGVAEFVDIIDPAMHETIVPVRSGGIELPALDLALAARDARRAATPSGFVAAGYDVMRDFEHQLVRVVRDGATWLEFYAERPENCPASRPVLGFFLLDTQFRIVRRHVDSAAVEQRRYRLRVPTDSGAFLYSLELLDPACRFAARARYLITAPAAASMDLSDIVLAEEVRMAEARRIGDRMPITPRYRPVVRPGEPVHFYWELYGLAAGEARRDRLSVSVQVVDVLRRPVPVGRLGWVARTARDQRPALDTRYDVTVPEGEGPLGMTVSLGLPADAEGVYLARVSVTDRATNETLVAERAFRVASAR